MTANPLALAHKEAGWLTQRAGLLFARIGTRAHPRGAVVASYRLARRSLRASLRAGFAYQTPELLSGLRQTIQAQAFTVFTLAASAGQEAASRQLAAYNAQLATPGTASAPIVPALQAVLSTVDRQITTFQALLATGADEDTLLGTPDGERTGVLQSAPVAGDLAFWVVELALLSMLAALGDGRATLANGKPVQFQKQAIAGLDERTTDCCLRVHGQVVPLTGKFHLTGTPRYADDMAHSPFHRWCRTSVALYLPEYDDGLTAAMRQAANTIQAERAAGGSGYRHPADAFA